MFIFLKFKRKFKSKKLMQSQQLNAKIDAKKIENVY